MTQLSMARVPSSAFKLFPQSQHFSVLHLGVGPKCEGRCRRSLYIPL